MRNLNKAKPRHNANKRAKLSANPEDDKNSDASKHSDTEQQVNQAEAEETKDQEQPQTTDGNILFQPKMPVRKQVVEDSDSSEFDEDRFEHLAKPALMTENDDAKKEEGSEVEDDDEDDDEVNLGAEGGEDEMSEKTESDCEVESSEEELGVTGSKKVQQQHADESSGDDVSDGEAQFLKAQEAEQ